MFGIIKGGHRMSQYIIGSKHKYSGNFSISPNPEIHTDFKVAIKEADRLAAKVTDKKFIVFEVKAVKYATEVVSDTSI